MNKSLPCILLISSVLSVSLFGGKNIGLTKEIDNRREGVICAVEGEAVYTDGFWVEEDETVYLLETYNCAVRELKQKSSRNIPLSEAVLPADIISDKDKLYIFDDILYELQVYTGQGELLVRSKIELKEDYVKGLVKTEQGVAVQTYKGKQIFVDLESGKQKIQKDKEIPQVNTAGYDAAEYIGTDEEGCVYSVHTNLVKDCSVISGELTLRAASAEGELLGSYILPMEEYGYLPDTYLQVLPNGNIYILIPGEGSIEVRKIALKELPESGLKNISDAAAQTESDYAGATRYRKRIGTACTEIISISREEVFERAKNMAEYEWTLKKTHTRTSKSEAGVVLPKEIAALQKKHEGESSWSETVKGIPYCWGGFYALDVGTRNRTFQSVLDKYYVAGNIGTEGYYKYMTAGLDCSGYVSAALGFNEKKSTHGLSDLGSKVSDIRKLELMDILVNPGDHIIFFCGWLNDGTMLISESAKREGKVVIHPRSINELVVGGNYQMRSPW